MSLPAFLLHLRRFFQSPKLLRWIVPSHTVCCSSSTHCSFCWPVLVEFGTDPVNRQIIRSHRFSTQECSGSFKEIVIRIFEWYGSYSSMDSLSIIQMWLVLFLPLVNRDVFRLLISLIWVRYSIRLSIDSFPYRHDISLDQIKHIWSWNRWVKWMKNCLPYSSYIDWFPFQARHPISLDIWWEPYHLMVWIMDEWRWISLHAHQALLLSPLPLPLQPESLFQSEYLLIEIQVCVIRIGSLSLFCLGKVVPTPSSIGSIASLNGMVLEEDCDNVLLWLQNYRSHQIDVDHRREEQRR